MTSKEQRRLVGAIARVNPTIKSVALPFEEAASIREQIIWEVCVEFGIEFEQALVWADTERMT